MKIKISSILDIGKERDNNEDALAFCPDLTNPNWETSKMPSYIPLGKHGAITIVADGMGGANAGEVASDISICTVKERFSSERIQEVIGDNDRIKELLHKVVQQADDKINKRILTDPDTLGMGTTIVICWILNNKAYIAWCGDSRCYVYNPVTGLKLLTHDHSLVQEMVDNGEITEEEAFQHPDSNIITRGLGDFNSEVYPDIAVYDIKPNDTLLLCSDGLCGYCDDRSIKDVLSHNFINIDDCCEQLLQLAYDAGGHDNISIIIASCINDQQEEPQKATWGQKFKRLMGLMS